MNASSLASELELSFVIQRALNAEVRIDGVSQGRFDEGLVVLFGVGVKETTKAEALAQYQESDFAQALKQLSPVLSKCAEKVIGLRIFEDENGKMNLSLNDQKGGLYVVSQFTLFADCKKGLRPSFTRALKPEWAKAIYEELLRRFNELHATVFSGVFAADMKVSFTNDGPVTILLKADAAGIM